MKFNVEDHFKKRTGPLIKQKKEEMMLGKQEYVDLKLFTSNFKKKMENQDRQTEKKLRVTLISLKEA